MALHRKQVTYSSRANHAARAAHAKGKKQFQTYDTSAIRAKPHYGRIAFGVGVALVAAIVLFFAIRGVLGMVFTPELLEEGTTVQFVVADGATTNSIAQDLAEAKLIGRSSEFSDAAKKAGAASSLKPGTYTIVAGTSADDIVKMMVAGPKSVTFTVTEGATLPAVARAVAKGYGGSITEEEFTSAALNASAYAKDYPFVEGAYNNSLEGFLFPKTYDVKDGATADAVVRQMLSQYQVEVAKLSYDYPTSRGLSAYDVLKLASVVEKESDDVSRGTVASVFYNRLAQNMRLQSDATVAYVVGRNPTPDDIDNTNSPYNTYKQAGLPAGPICSPGIESLKAVCQPEQTNYLFFYFRNNDQGGLDYYFSETYEQHQAAIAG